MKVAVCSRSFSAHPILRAELLASFPDACFNDSGHQLQGPDLLAFLHGVNGAIVGLERIDDALLEACPSVRVIAKFGVGLDRIDLPALDRRGVRIGWTPGVNAPAVAEVVLARTIELLRHLHTSDAEVRAGRFPLRVGRSLGSCTIGLIGCGHVGKTVARVFRRFGATVLAHDIRDYPDFYRDEAVTPVDLDTLLATADVVSLHVPLTPRTRGLMNPAAFARMKPGALFLNTARGEVVDAAALEDALIGGHLAGAALDVFDPEPPTGSRLLGLANVRLSAHLAGSSDASTLAMGRAAIAGLSGHQPAASLLDVVT